MKNILIVVGSGRPGGNTAQLVDAFARGAERSGHHVEIVDLTKTKVGGCIGCNKCRWGKPCVLKDDFNGLVPSIKSADLIVFASPMYLFSWSSRIRAFLERFYSLLEPDPNPPLGRYGRYPFARDCALLMTAADGDFWTFEQIMSEYRFTLVQYMGFRDKGHVLAYGCGSCEEPPRVDPVYLEKAFEFGQNVYPAEN